MELLLGAVVTLLTQVYKWFVTKFGAERAKSWTLIIVLFLSLAGTIGWKGYNNEVDWTNLEQLVSIAGLAIGYYEVIIKRVFIPIFNKFKK